MSTGTQSSALRDYLERGFPAGRPEAEAELARLEYVSRVAREYVEEAVPALTAFARLGHACTAPAARRIYVASSWRNPHQPGVVALLRDHGHEVYDFRNPEGAAHGFSWDEVASDPCWRGIDEDWHRWDAKRYREALDHPAAKRGLGLDFSGMRWADTFVLVQQCGRSAHLELGWAIGAGKRTAVFFPDGVGGPGEFEPELMTRLADATLIGRNELIAWLGGEPS